MDLAWPFSALATAAGGLARVIHCLRWPDGPGPSIQRELATLPNAAAVRLALRWAPAKPDDSATWLKDQMLVDYEGGIAWLSHQWEWSDLIEGGLPAITERLSTMSEPGDAPVLGHTRPAANPPEYPLLRNPGSRLQYLGGVLEEAEPTARRPRGPGEQLSPRLPGHVGGPTPMWNGALQLEAMNAAVSNAPAEIPSSNSAPTRLPSESERPIVARLIRSKASVITALGLEQSNHQHLEILTSQGRLTMGPGGSKKLAEFLFHHQALWDTAQPVLDAKLEAKRKAALASKEKPGSVGRKSATNRHDHSGK
jgi:hypothetical protein